MYVLFSGIMERTYSIGRKIQDEVSSAKEEEGKSHSQTHTASSRYSTSLALDYHVNGTNCIKIDTKLVFVFKID